MVIESSKIETKFNYNWDDIVYIYDIDVKLIKVIKIESRIGVDIYYIGYVFDSEDETPHSIKPFYLVINRLFGRIEKIEGSNHGYLVVDINNKKKLLIFLMKYGNILNKELLLMEYGHLLKKNLFLIMKIMK